MEMTNSTSHNPKIYLNLTIIPNAKKNEVIGFIEDKSLKIKISSPPENNKANKELIKFLAKKLKISKNQIQIIKGKKSKKKTICIENINVLIF